MSELIATPPPGLVKSGLQHGPIGPRSAHVCLDMQRLFAPASIWATPWMERVLPIAASLARAQAHSTVFTRFIPPRRAEDAPGAWARYYRRWPQVTLEHVDPALLELMPELAALAPPALVVDKGVYSPFNSSAFVRILHRRRIDTLVLSGAETDVCVLATVMDAVDRGYRVIVARDAVCSSSDQTHDALMTLYHTRFSTQVEIADTAEIIGAWPHS